MSCKLYLVPEDVINTWRADQRRNTVDKPIDTMVNQMDSKLSNILDSKISDYDKDKLYSQELGKYMSMRNQKITVPSSQPFSSDMLTSIPKMYRNKAAGLLQYLQSDKDIDWDADGHLYIGQQKIDNSHILDLVHDAMRLRKKVSRPQGWRELSSHLRRRNVPRELVGNPTYFTPPTSPDKSSSNVSSLTSPYKPGRGVKRASFHTYKPLSTRKKRVIGVDIPVPLSEKNQRKSKLQGIKKIKQWISV